MRSLPLAVTGTAAVLAVAVFKLVQPGILISAEHVTYDGMVRIAGLPTPSGKVTVVVIDEASLRREGRWPWPRARLAELLSAILDSGAAVVALDIMFPEPDSAPAPGQPGRTNDDALAASIASGRVVLGYYFDFQSASLSKSPQCLLHAAPLVMIGDRDSVELPFFRAASVVCSLPVLFRAAKGSGFLNAGPDQDGKLRRATTLIRFGHLMYPSLALAALIERERVRGLTLRTEWHGGTVLQVGTRSVGLGRGGEMMMRFHGPSGSLPRVSAADVFDRKVPSDSMRDQIVVVGASAMGIQDVIATPVDPLLMGVEFQAAAIDNLLTGDYLRRPPVAALLELFVLLSLGVASVAAMVRLRMAFGVASILSAIGGLWLASGLVLRTVGWFVSPLTPTLAICLGTGITGPMSLAARKKKAEESARRQEAAKNFALMAVAGIVDLRTPGSGQRTVRLAGYLRLLCASAARHTRFRSQLNAETIDLLVQLATIHDLGKAGVPDRVMLKPGPLTPDEAASMRRHVEHGRALIERAWRQAGSVDEIVFRLAIELAYSHHERWDGTGYPQGLMADKIPIPGRLLAIAEVYDALVCPDTSQDPMPHEVAVKVLAAGRGRLFDPDLIDCFLGHHESWREIAEKLGGEKRRRGTSV